MIFNWDLLKHPANWAIVILMLVIAGAAGHYALAYFGANASGPGSTKQVGNLTETPAVPDRNDVALSVLAG